MTNHQKSSTLNVIAALMLLATIVLRHTTDDPTAQRWANDFIPPIAFIMIGIAIRYSIRARKESNSVR